MPETENSSAQNTGNTGTTETSEQNNQPKTSLESLLSGLDESARNAVLGEVRSARSDAARYRTERNSAQEKAGKYDELVQAQQTAEQRAQDAQRAAEEKAAAAVNRAVGAEIKAAAKDFADPDDAVRFLDAASYVDEKGDIDTARITADLSTLLTSKPHLKRIAEESRRQPNPDPSAGAGNNGKSASSDPAQVLQAFFANQLGRTG